MALFRINLSTAPGSMSSKSLVTVVRTTTRLPLGTVRFHSMDEEVIDLTINGRGTKLKDDVMFGFRWYFKPTSFPRIKWWWTKGKANGLRLADDKEGGQTIATLTGDVLVVEPIGLSEPAVDEVVLAAVAIWEQRRRKDKDNDQAVEGLDAIGQIAGAIGGGGA